MFEIIENLLIQLVNLIPSLLVFTLVMNLICSMLFDRRQYKMVGLFLLGACLGCSCMTCYDFYKENQYLTKKIEKLTKKKEEE